MAKRGPKPKKHWSLVHIAGFLDAKDPDRYTWYIESRDRDARIRREFTDDEWQSLNHYLGSQVWQSDGATLGPLFPPEHLAGLVTKLTKAGLLTHESQARESIEWARIASYINCLDFEPIVVDFGEASRLTRFGSLDSRAISDLLPFGPDSSETLASVLAEQKIFPNTDGLYLQSDVTTSAHWKRGRLGYKNGRAGAREGERYDNDRVALCAHYMLNNTTSEFAEADRQRRELVDVARIHTRLAGELKRCKTESKLAAAAYRAAKESKHPYVEKLQTSAQAAKLAAEVKERNVDDAWARCKGAEEKLSRYRQKDAKLDAFYDALYGPTNALRISDQRGSGNTPAVMREMFRRALSRAEEAFEADMYRAEEAAWEVLPIDFNGPVDLRVAYTLSRVELRPKLVRMRHWRDVFWRTKRPRLLDLRQGDN